VAVRLRSRGGGAVDGEVKEVLRPVDEGDVSYIPGRFQSRRGHAIQETIILGVSRVNEHLKLLRAMSSRCQVVVVVRRCWSLRGNLRHQFP
jgi:hypothetical protein